MDTTVMPMPSLAPAFTYTQRLAKGLGRRCRDDGVPGAELAEEVGGVGVVV